jgi:hypothetical protein
VETEDDLFVDETDVTFSEKSSSSRVVRYSEEG